MQRCACTYVGVRVRVCVSFDCMHFHAFLRATRRYTCKEIDGVSIFDRSSLLIRKVSIESSKGRLLPPWTEKQGNFRRIGFDE